MRLVTTKSSILRKILLPMILVAILCVCAVFVGIKAMPSVKSSYEDLSYLDDSSVGGYANGSFVQGGEYYSADVDQSADYAAYAGKTSGGTLGIAATKSDIPDTGSTTLSLASTNFNINSNVTYDYYYAGKASSDNHYIGTGYFGADTNNRKQEDQIRTYFVYVELTGNMLTAARTGNLSVSMSANVGTRRDDNQKISYGLGFIHASSLTSSNSLRGACDSLDAFEGKLATYGRTGWINDKTDSKAVSVNAARIPYNNDTSTNSRTFVAIGMSCFSHSSTVMGIGGNSPCAFIKDITLSFSYSATLTVKNTDAHGSAVCYFYQNGSTTTPSPSTVSPGGAKTFTSKSIKDYIAILPNETIANYRFGSAVLANSNSSSNYRFCGYGNETTRPTTDTKPGIIVSNTPQTYANLQKPTDSALGTFSYNQNYSFVFADEKECVLNFFARQYRIIYRPNGGSPTSNKTVTYRYGVAATIPTVASNFTNGTKVGSGWTCTSYSINDGASTQSCSSTQYIEGNSISHAGHTGVGDLNSNLIIVYLDAVWVSASADYTTNSDYTFTITNTEGAGSLYADVTYTISYSFTGHTLKQVYAVYKSAANGGGDLAGQTIALSKLSDTRWVLYGICGNCTLVPEWQANSYSITYKDMNSSYAYASGTDLADYYVYGTAKYLPRPTRSGYAFNYWTITSGNNGGISSNTLSTTQYGNLTLTANWVDVDTVETNVSSSIPLGASWGYARTTYKAGSSTKDWWSFSYKSTGYRLDYVDGNTNGSEMIHDSGTGYSLKSSGWASTINSTGYRMKDRDYSWQYMFLKIPVATLANYGPYGSKITKVSASLATAYYLVADNGNALGTDECWAQAWGCMTYSATSYSSTASGGTNYDYFNGLSYTSLGNEFRKNCEKSVVAAHQSNVAVTLQNSQSSGVTSGYFYLGIRMKIDNCTNDDCGGGILVTSCPITVTYSNGSSYTISYNANGGTGNAGTSVTNGSKTIKLPYNPYTRTGYMFTGWKIGTTSYNAGASVTISTTTTITAQWTKKKYPVITYDVWTDGTEALGGTATVVTTPRKEYYVEHGSSISATPGATTNTSYTSSDIYAYAGKNSYAGFTLKQTSPLTKSTSWTSSTYSHPMLDANVLSGTPSGTTLTSSATGACWGYFVWLLDQPSLTSDSSLTKTYGEDESGINLTSQINASHPSGTLSYVWSKGSNTPTFYKNDTVIYAVEESGTYSCVVTATVTKSGTSLQRKRTATCTVTINPIYLIIVRDGDTSTFEYTGEVRRYPVAAEVDLSRYTGKSDEFKKRLQTVFATEKAEGVPWFNDRSGSTAKTYWTKGVTDTLVGLGYTAAIGSYYNGTIINGYATFRDAGDYFVSAINLNNTGENTFNKNYCWSQHADTDDTNPNKGQMYSLSSLDQGTTGTVTATITAAPYLNIYALYTEKTFGRLADAVEGYPRGIDYGDKGSYNASQWCLAFQGMLGNDLSTFAPLLIGYLRRDTSSLFSQNAGSYDVFLDESFLNDPALYPLLNNYGMVKASGASYATSSTITMYWLDESGSAMTDGGYNFCSAVSGYTGLRNNFVIKPKDISLQNTSPDTEYIYNGNQLGPNQIVSSGLLSAMERDAFAIGYGVYFTLYFYGVPLPADWNTNYTTDAARKAYVDANLSKKVIIGQAGKNFALDATEDSIAVTEKNAGKYGVAFVLPAYKKSDDTYAENPNYHLNNYLYVQWEVKQRTVNVSASKTSTTFGDKDYGGIVLTFGSNTDTGNIIGSETIYLKTVNYTFNDSASTSNLRYYDLTGSATGEGCSLISNNSRFKFYGSYYGSYGIEILNAQSKGTTAELASSGMYGPSYGNNYKLLATDSYSNSTRVLARPLTTEGWKYTVGETTYDSKPSDAAFIYQYGVSKGVKITINDLFASDFGDDISGTGSSFVRIPLSDIRNTDRIGLTKSITADSAYTAVVDKSGTSITYTMSAVNAGAYSTAVSGVTYKIGNTSYTNYSLSSTLETEFAIGKKTVKLVWTLDSDTNNTGYTLVFDATSHTMNARFACATSPSTLATDDYLVYKNDVVDESMTSVYTTYVFPSGTPGLGPDGAATTRATYTIAKSNHTATNAGTTTASVTQINSGNYIIATDSATGGNRTQSWAITRRTFTMQLPGDRSVNYIYDGNQKSVALYLVADNSDGKTVEVNISDFNAVVAPGSGANFVTNASFNPVSKTFSAVDVGMYTLVYNAGTGINVGTNWILTGSANYTGDNYMFAIVPMVITYSPNSTTQQYTSGNLRDNFRPSPRGSVDTSSAVPTYSPAEIIHAGDYTLRVVSLSGSDNFVLAAPAAANPADEPWYRKIPQYVSYYTDAAAIATYSIPVTVTRKKIELDTTTINANLPDYTYDGTTKGYTLQNIFDNYVNEKLFPSDRSDGTTSRYTLTGVAQTGKNVGGYSLSITGFNPYNGYTDYEFSFAEGETAYTFPWNINKRVIDISFTAYHSGGSGFYYDGNDHGYVMTVSNIVTGEDLLLTYSQSNLGLSASGMTINNGKTVTLAYSYAKTYSISDLAISDGNNGLASNYRLADDSGISWTIVRKIVEITWHNTSVVYRAGVYNPSNGGAYAEITNLIDDDTVGITYDTTVFPSDAGDYTLEVVALTGANAANYTLIGCTNLDTEWHILPKEISVYTWAGDSTFDGFDVVYDGEPHSVTATPAYGAMSDTDGKVYDSDMVVDPSLPKIGFTYSTAAGFVTNATVAGTYQTKITGIKNSSNYSLKESASNVQEWRILPRDLTVTFRYNYGTEIVYCKADRGVVITVAGIVLGDYSVHNYLKFKVVTTEGTFTVNSGSTNNTTTYTHTLRGQAVGTYKASIQIDTENSPRASSYNLVAAEGTASDFSIEFEITPLPAVLEWKLVDYQGNQHASFNTEYDSRIHSLVASVSNSLDGDIDVTVEDGSATYVGNYEGRATALGNDNYTLTNATNISRTFSIYARSLDFAFGGANSYTYNGHYQSKTLTVSKAFAADTLYFKVSFYRVANETSTLVKTATVSFDSLTQKTFVAADFAATINAGTYSVTLDQSVYTAGGEINDNYSLPASGRTASYTIGKATVALSGVWTYTSARSNGTYTQPLVYNASEFTFATTLNADSLFVRDDNSQKDSIILTYSGEKQTDVCTDNTATVSITAESGAYYENYSVPAAGSTLSYTILPKEVALFWTNYENIVYDGNRHKVTAVTQSGAQSDGDGKVYDGDEVNVLTYQNNVGYKDANVEHTTVAVALDNNNYTIGSGDTLIWSIAPLPVELVWSADSLKYDGTTKTVTATVNNQVSGDTLALTYSNNAFINKGNYTAEVTATGNPNYTIENGTDIRHDWEITPVTLQFSANGLSFTYNGESQGVKININGIVNADKELSKLSYTVNTDKVQTVVITGGSDDTVPAFITATAINADTYTVEISGLTGSSKDNYVLEEAVSYSYKIAPKPIAVTWSDDSGYVYSHSDFEVSATVTNKAKSTDEITLTYKTDGVDGNKAMHAGSHTTQITALSNPNYTVSGASGLKNEGWTIDPKPLTDIVFKIGGVSGITSAVYKGSEYAITAEAVFGATSATDGKAYTGDTVTLGCYINNSPAKATLAGSYTATVRCANTDYDVSDVTFDFDIDRRPLTLSLSAIPASGFIYNGQDQGVTVTLTNLVLEDNTIENVHLDYTFDGSVADPIRENTTLRRFFYGKNAAVYTLTDGTIAGNKATNYYIVDGDNNEVESFEFSFEIVQKEITTEIEANIGQNKLVYSATAVSSDKLRVSFSSLVPGETLTATNNDFNVTYYSGATAISAPTDVGVYSAKIALNGSSNLSKNYILTGTTQFPFEIIPYKITPSMVSYTLNGSTVDIDALSFVENQSKTICATISDDVYAATSGLGLQYIYFGFCTCAIDATSEEEIKESGDISHQWLLDGNNFHTTGPVHAGSYCMVMTLTGANAANFAFEGFDGYDSDYFTEDTVNGVSGTYLTYKQAGSNVNIAMNKPLPQLSANVAAVKFGIARSADLGIDVEITADTLPYKGAYYRPSDNISVPGLPAVTSSGSSSSIRVLINSEEYSYEQYTTRDIVKNAGVYNILIYDENMVGHELSGCDLFKEGAQINVGVRLTVSKSKITVTDTSSSSTSTTAQWSKIYDKNSNYTYYSYVNGTTFNGASTDGVISGTTVTVSAAYTSVNAGAADIEFTLGGADGSNYYLVFKNNDNSECSCTANEAGTKFTVEGTIDKKLISQISNADKVYDGNTNAAFDIESNDVIPGDTVSVTGVYASANVGLRAITGIHTSDQNYYVSSATAEGTISPKSLNVIWTGNNSETEYDGNQHGISVTIENMLSGDCAEVIYYSGNNITAGTIPAGTSEYEFKETAANAYSVNLSLKENSNYSFNVSDSSAGWTITRRVLGITFKTDNLTGTYIAAWDQENFTVVYSGVARSVTAVITSNLVEGDDVTLELKNNTATNVNSYTAEVTALSGADSNNYDLPETVTRNWSITKADIDESFVTMSNVETTYDGDLHGAEISSAVTQHGIHIDVTYTGGEEALGENGLNALRHVRMNDDKTEVLAVEITATLNAGNNYNTAVRTATVKLNPETIRLITISDKLNEVYNAEAHSIFVDTYITSHDDVLNVAYTISDGTTESEGNSAINAGEYTVTATVGADNYDYKLHTISATLKIDKAQIDESLINVGANKTVTYNTQLHGIETTISKTQYGDAVTVSYRGGEEENSGTARNQGSYEITAVITAPNGNYYDFTTAKRTLTIEAKEIDLTFPSSALTYTGTTQTITVTFAKGATNDTDGLVYDSDSVTVRLNYMGTEGAALNQTVLRNAGKYTVTASLSNGNYTPRNATATLVVNKAVISKYYFVGKETDYDNELHYLSINTENSALDTANMIVSVTLLGSDTATVDYTFNNVSAESEYNTAFVGVKNASSIPYYIKAKINAGDNYEPWERTATLIINKARIGSYQMNEITTTYDKEAHKIEVSVDPSQIVDNVYHTIYGDPVVIRYTISDGNAETNGNSAINVGEYTVYAHFDFDSAIAINYEETTLSATLKINKVRLGTITLSGGTYTYDGSEHNAIIGLPSGTTPSLTLDGDNIFAEFALGKKDTFSVDYEIEDFEGTALHVGSYDFVMTITPAPAIADNYYPVETLRATVNITASKISDATGTPFEKGVNVFFNGATIPYDSYTHYVILASTSAGSVLSTNPNDVVTQTAIHPQNVTDVTDTATVSYSADGATFTGARHAGTYEITASVSHADYEPFTIDCTLVIEKVYVEYYFVGTERIYDMQRHYASIGTENRYYDQVGITTVSLKGTDTATVSYTYTSDTHGSGAFTGAIYVDEYVITAKMNISEEIDANYYDWGTGNSTTVSLKITPYHTDMIWHNVSESYTYNGTKRTNITASFIAADGTTEEEATVTFIGTSGKAAGDTEFKNAGNYTVTASHEREANYVFTDKTKELVMKKASIDKYLSDDTLEYNATTYYLTLDSTEATTVFSDTITVFNETLPVEYTYSKKGMPGVHDSYMNNGTLQELTYGARNAGEYTVTANVVLGEGESNYIAWTEPRSATLTINRITLTMSHIGDFDKTYDGTKTVLDYSINGVDEGNTDYIWFVAEYSDQHAGENKSISVNAYTISDDYAYLKNNYRLPASKTGTINKRKITVNTEFSFWRKMYDGLDTWINNPIALVAIDFDDLTKANNNIIEGDEITLTARYNSKNVAHSNKILFTLTGSAAGNYYIDNLDFSDDVSATNRLIYPRSAQIVWSDRTTDYNGYEQTITAYLPVLGLDAQSGNGRIDIPVDLVQTKAGDGTTLSTPITNATYKNAGTYTATINVNKTDEADPDTLINYGITNISAEFIINQASLEVEWTLKNSGYIYNGTSQKGDVSASVELLGEDYSSSASAITTTFTKNEVTADFINAGSYIAEASLAPAFTNNYVLTSNVTMPVNIERAEITNIKFEGSDSWNYYKGETHFFFVTSLANSNGFDTIVGTEVPEGVPAVFKYAYDDIVINIRYSGGKIYYNGDENTANGVATVQNDSYEIEAFVDITDNYKAWRRSITVTVNKGVIDNIVLVGDSVEYDGNPHSIYAHNKTTENPPAPSSKMQVRLPDGRDADITYSITVTSYPNTDFVMAHSYTGDEISATNAGLYLVNAYINDANYLAWSAPSDTEEIVYLQIRQKVSLVHWEYGTDQEADFTYNATDQTDQIMARIVLTDKDAEGAASNKLYLNIDINLLSLIEGDIDALDSALKSAFVVAGEYKFVSSIPVNNDADNRIYNNYVLDSSKEVLVDMKQFIVSIQWYYLDGHHGQNAIYDPANPCVYDATEHGVRAEGTDFNGNPMDILTAGDFSAVNAKDDYRASVSKIKDGSDTVNVNGHNYSLGYNLNYTLANDSLVWSIQPRPISILIANDNALSKVYDGSSDFTFGTPTKRDYADPDNPGAICLEITYLTTNKNAMSYDSKFAYTLTNIIPADKEEGVTLEIYTITADLPNINAKKATVIFNSLTMQNTNYIIVSDISGNDSDYDNLITPLNIKMSFAFASHVYNGMTFSETMTADDAISGTQSCTDAYGMALFEMKTLPEDTYLSELVSGNYITGTISINGATSAGTYPLVGTNIKIADATGTENYRIQNFVDGQYVIKQRRIAVDYTNTLQSLQQTPYSNITGTINLERSDNSDLEQTNGTLADLIGSLSINMINSWTSETYTSYTRIYDADNLKATPSDSVNYYIESQPILQITYLKVDKTAANKYTFNVFTIDDFVHIDSDISGLMQTKSRFDLDYSPVYNQKATINGIKNGSYTTMASIDDFSAEYNGCGYSIKNINVITKEESEYVGLFNEISNGKISNLTLSGINVYAYGEYVSVGGFIGKASENVTLSNVSYDGTIFARVPDGGETNIGGLFGETDSISIENVNATVNIRAVAGSANLINIGGLVGKASDCSISNVNMFNDITVIVTGSVLEKYYGGIVGYVEECTVTDCSYLENGIYVNSQGTAVMVNRALGNESDTGNSSLSYSGFMSDSTLAGMITTNVLRSYLLPQNETGTTTNVVHITNYRQLSLIVAYPYMNFVVRNDISGPFPIRTYRRGLSGSVTYENSNIVIKAAVPSTINLVDAVLDESRAVLIRKEDEYVDIE